MSVNKHMPSVRTVSRILNMPEEFFDSELPDTRNYGVDVVPLLRLWGEYKAGFRSALNSFDADFFVVANFNVPLVSWDWCRGRLNLLDMKIGRALLGKRWSSFPESERLHWIAVPEHATYWHYNSLWHVPAKYQEEFCIEAPGLWRQIVPSGSLDLQKIGSLSSDHDRTRGYTGKTFHPRLSIDQTVTSAELRRKSVGKKEPIA